VEESKGGAKRDGSSLVKEHDLQGLRVIHSHGEERSGILQKDSFQEECLEQSLQLLQKVKTGTA
jgi:hypothetical protein